MLKDKKKLIYPVAFLLLLLAGLAYKLFARSNYSGLPVIMASEVVSESESALSLESGSEGFGSEKNVEKGVEKIKIYICGEVNSPGIFEVEKGTILNDVALLAGGFTENAATDHLNLVYSFESNMSIFIPNEGNLEEGDSVIMRGGGSGGSGVSGEMSGVQGGLININTASLEQLKTLPGVGDSTANAIITYREDHRFERIEDIMNVSGIGEAKFNKLRSLICV